MFIYDKKLQYPVKIDKPNPRLAAIIISQYGGPDGELGASLRYLSQRYSMPFDELKGLLTDIGTEELAHVEIISSMIYQLTDGATPEELKAAGMDTSYAQFGHGIQPSDANGSPFTTSYINVFSDPVTDLHENMAAEQKALATYYQLINLTDDPDIKDVLSFLGQREITHYQRFGEALMDVYDFTNCKKIF